MPPVISYNPPTTTVRLSGPVTVGPVAQSSDVSLAGALVVESSAHAANKNNNIIPMNPHKIFPFFPTLKSPLFLINFLI